MKRYLFQGDSITDAGRYKENCYDLGKGYPNIMSGSLTSKYPNEIEFINRGISENRIVDLYQRIKADKLEEEFLKIK